MKSRALLTIAACCSLAIALLQAVISFSPQWSLLFGAPASLAAHPMRLLAAGLAAALVFVAFALYAAAGAGLIRRLPGMRAVLLSIGAIYSLRGLMIIPVLLVMAGRVPMAEPLPPMAIPSSLVSLVVGAIYLAGTVRRWRELSESGPSGRRPWWYGSRGEWYVLAQIALIGLVIFGPRSLPGVPLWGGGVSRVAMAAGIALMGCGAALLLSAIPRHGRHLTPLPFPGAQATLIESGPYALVRHPMYGGGVLFAVGWALFVRSYLTLAYAAALLVFADIKASREERWLAEKFPGYGAYRRRVRKLIPFLY